MNRVYVLGINNFDALDGFMTSEDMKVFFDKHACEKWVQEETKRQAKKGFKLIEIKLIESQSDPEYWEFVKETLHGNYRHVFYGQYREVIN